MDRLKQLIFPQKCKCCFKLARADNLCRRCRAELAKEKRESFTVETKFEFVDKAYASYRYKGARRKGIQNAKFRRPASFLNSFLTDISRDIEKILGENNFDMIISSPAHKSKFYKTEYDLPEQMAKRISEKFSLNNRRPVVKIKKTKTQHSLKLEERKANLIDAFEVRLDIKDKSILLIDDVISTGQTVSVIAKELKLAGAKTVVVWAYAYNDGKEK